VEVPVAGALALYAAALAGGGDSDRLRRTAPRIEVGCH